MLSPDELQLVNNTGWILTKRRVMEKAVHLFSDLSGKMRDIIEKEKDGLPQTVVLSEPKISKGENYQQLPYVILDYPRCFDATNVFAIRTMCWWGNFFSITLQLAGTYKKMFEGALEKNTDVLKNDDYYICINEDQWQHHFEQDNYIAVNTMAGSAIKDILLQQPFIKIARKFSLQRWNEMPGLLEGSFSAIIQLVKT